MNFDSSNTMLLKQQLAFWYLNKIMYKNPYLKMFNTGAKESILMTMGMAESLKNESLKEIVNYSDYEYNQVRELYDSSINSDISKFFKTYSLKRNGLTIDVNLFLLKLSQDLYAVSIGLKRKVPDIAVLSEQEVIQFLFNRCAVITRNDLTKVFKKDVKKYDIIMQNELTKCSREELKEIASFEKPILTLRQIFDKDKTCAINYAYGFIEQLIIDDVIDFKKLIKSQLKIKGRVFTKKVDGVIYYMIPFYMHE